MRRKTGEVSKNAKVVAVAAEMPSGLGADGCIIYVASYTLLLASNWSAVLQAGLA